MSETEERSTDLSELMVWPTSLAQWRQYPPCESPETEYNLQFWSQMAEDFALQGVRLYESYIEARLPFLRIPPEDSYEQLRMPPDTYETEPGSYLSSRNLQQKSASVYPGVLRDGSDVFVRVVSKGAPPSRQLEILRYLAQETHRSHPHNHAIPIVQELVFRDWVFVVMPRMSAASLSDRTITTGRNWFTTISEVLECVVQMLEGFAFLHDHLIAHQDISDANIVVNHLGYRDYGFLSRFPCRYYIIDFEVAVQVPHDSDRKVVGPPLKDFTPSRLAPEVDTHSEGRAHCPFRADVWQLGLLLFRAFPTQSEHIARLARTMLARDPEARPTMREAYQTICDIRGSLSDDELASPVLHNFVVDTAKAEEVSAMLDTFLQGGSIGVRTWKDYE